MGESSHRHMAGEIISRSGQLKVVILGAGNVATHLAMALNDHCEILQIYNRSIGNARTIADKINSDAVADISDIRDDADLYIIALSDDAILPTVDKLGKRRGIWVHTSGSTPLEVLSPLSDKIGVFYPMQTFTKGIPVKFSEVPFFLEASSREVDDALRSLALKLSPNVRTISSRQRQLLHIAAVFACNFTDYMWVESAKLLDEIGSDFSVMEPLISAIFKKAISYGPKNSLTGPARRGDTKVIDRHLKELSGDTKEIYRLLSDSIIKTFSNTSL